MAESLRVRVFTSILAWVTGAGMVSVILLGHRVLGLHFGATLFVQSASFCIALAALSSGVFAGGLRFDKHPQRSACGRPLILAGFWLFALTWLEIPLFSLDQHLGRTLSLVLITTVFWGPPLFLVGGVLPFLVRLAPGESRPTSFHAGVRLALLAFGCASGMLLCGYYFIPALGVGVSWKIVGVSFVIFGVLALRMKPGSMMGLLFQIPVLLGVAWLLPSGAYHSKGEQPVREEDSRYSHLEAYSQNSISRFMVDGRLVGTVDMRDGRSLLPVEPVLALPVLFRKEPGRALILGMGDGALVHAFARADWKLEVVELDAKVIRMAYECFGLSPHEASVFQSDARTYLALNRDLFDAIIFHVFPGGQLPYTLVSQEAMALAASRLTPGGVLVVPVWSTAPDDEGLLALGATLQQQFAHVFLLALSDSQAKPALRVFVASQAEQDIQEADQALAYASTVWSKRQRWSISGKVITDDLNPWDSYADRVAEQWERAGS